MRNLHRLFRLAVTLAGRYGRQVDDMMDIHFETVRIAVEMARSGSRCGRPARGPR
ncbi:MAG: hypothetical protein L0332_26050 [Chloroflexi bacterium]|nr:hypothetical protein [Chloroflexota bacterium]MCI0645114.1 hypothetical protein [Chloroflexota bacterium]MCI0730162.1 hypothetical protein [Chloroflexota bacterium]